MLHMMLTVSGSQPNIHYIDDENILFFTNFDIGQYADLSRITLLVDGQEIESFAEDFAGRTIYQVDCSTVDCKHLNKQTVGGTKEVKFVFLDSESKQIGEVIMKDERKVSTTAVVIILVGVVVVAFGVALVSLKQCKNGRSKKSLSIVIPSTKEQSVSSERIDPAHIRESMQIIRQSIEADVAITPHTDALFKRDEPIDQIGHAVNGTIRLSLDVTKLGQYGMMENPSDEQDSLSEKVNSLCTDFTISTQKLQRHADEKKKGNIVQETLASMGKLPNYKQKDNLTIVPATIERHAEDYEVNASEEEETIELDVRDRSQE